MKIEELESAWAAQQPPPAGAGELAKLQRAVLPELARRGRMLGYGLFVCAFGLLAGPVLGVANYRYARAHHLAWHWVNLALGMAILSALLAYVFRRIRRHRAVQRQSADTLLALTTVSLASLEAEMEDCRRALWVWPGLIGLQLLTLAFNFPVAEYGWRPFALRAAATLGLPALMGLVFWRHYRVNLKPDQARQREILRQLR